jgi:phenylalanyl-tRNA synthetase alpha chain
MDELAEIFADLGFAVASGPEIEDDWHNFTALNMPESIRRARCTTLSICLT